MKTKELILASVILVGFFFSPYANAYVVVWENGERLCDVCPLPREVVAELMTQGYPQNISLGYHQKYFSLFWMPFVQWNGRFVLRSGNNYWELNNQSQRWISSTLGVPLASVRTPWRAYFPWGWYVVAGFVLFVIVLHFSNKRKTLQLLESSQYDVRYRKAYEILDNATDSSGFQAAVGHLCSQGISEDQAIAVLQAYLQKK